MALRSALGPHCVGLRVVVRRRVPGERGPTGGPALTDVLGVLEEWGAATLTVRTEAGEAVVIDRSLIVSGKPVPPRPSPRLRVGVVEAEHRALGSWPAPDVVRLGDWVLRAAGGFSARANSALLVGDPGLPWDEALASVAAFYDARGLPTWVQAGSPERERLVSEGWVQARPEGAEVAFLLGSVATALRRSSRWSSREPPRWSSREPPRWSSREPLGERVETTPRITLSPTLTDQWLADDQRALAHRAMAEHLLTSPDRVVFASVTDGDTALAKGRAVLVTDDWAGLTDIWVHPDHRRQGLARQVMAALLGWAAERGATTAYLQVRRDNEPALALYERLGFTIHHTYDYLRPGPAGNG